MIESFKCADTVALFAGKRGITADTARATMRATLARICHWNTATAA